MHHTFTHWPLQAQEVLHFDWFFRHPKEMSLIWVNLAVKISSLEKINKVRKNLILLMDLSKNRAERGTYHHVNADVSPVFPTSTHIWVRVASAILCVHWSVRLFWNSFRITDFIMWLWYNTCYSFLCNARSDVRTDIHLRDKLYAASIPTYDQFVPW